MGKKTRRNIFIDDDLYEAAAEAGEQTNRTRPDYINHAIKQQLKKDIEDKVIKLKKTMSI